MMMKGTAERVLVSVNPFRCRVWAFHDRIEDHITEETCRAEIESFLDHGQLVPVLGRKIFADPDHDVGVIYGARRLFVARHLNRPLLVELRALSDKESVVAMDIENRQRSDVSPYERGVAYATWVRSGLFESQQDLAKTLKVSASQVTRLIHLSRLPPVVLAAFDTPNQICENWGLQLAEALSDEQRRVRVIHRARMLAQAHPRPPADAIYRQLVSSAQSTRARLQGRDEAVRNSAGRILFRVRHQSASVSFVLPIRDASNNVIKRVRLLLTRVLEGAEEDDGLKCDGGHSSEGESPKRDSDSLRGAGATQLPEVN